MANMVDTFENDVLDGIVGVTTIFSTTMSIACFTADPTDTGSVASEYTANGCARKLLSTLFSSATGTAGSVSNDATVDFATATGDWSAVTHFAYMKAGTEAVSDMMVCF